MSLPEMIQAGWFLNTLIECVGTSDKSDEFRRRVVENAPGMESDAWNRLLEHERRRRFCKVLRSSSQLYLRDAKTFQVVVDYSSLDPREPEQLAYANEMAEKLEVVCDDWHASLFFGAAIVSAAPPFTEDRWFRHGWTSLYRLGKRLPKPGARVLRAYALAPIRYCVVYRNQMVSRWARDPIARDCVIIPLEHPDLDHDAQISVRMLEMRLEIVVAALTRIRWRSLVAASTVREVRRLLEHRRLGHTTVLLCLNAIHQLLAGYLQWGEWRVDSTVLEEMVLLVRSSPDYQVLTLPNLIHQVLLATVVQLRPDSRETGPTDESVDGLAEMLKMTYSTLRSALGDFKHVFAELLDYELKNDFTVTAARLARCIDVFASYAQLMNGLIAEAEVGKIR